MALTSLPAAYMRGGTSRALFFDQGDLPALQGGDRAAWDRIFCAALGSPDPAARQLDGMGGGITSLSKVAVIGPPTRPDADLDYTFAQVDVTAPVVGYRGNCGNISSAVGPYALWSGLVRAEGAQAALFATRYLLAQKARGAPGLLAAFHLGAAQGQRVGGVRPRGQRRALFTGANKSRLDGRSRSHYPANSRNVLHRIAKQCLLAEIARAGSAPQLSILCQSTHPPPRLHAALSRSLGATET